MHGCEASQLTDTLAFASSILTGWVCIRLTDVRLFENMLEVAGVFGVSEDWNRLLKLEFLALSAAS